jgi:biotin operon repressor
MTDPLIPDDLRDFILKHIDSIAQLEALLLLRNDDATWDVPRLSHRLYASEQQVAEAVNHLQADGFLTSRDSGYLYECRVPEQEEMVSRLADLYARHLIPVTNLIHSKPRRIREFAQAFRLRKDP